MTTEHKKKIQTNLTSIIEFSQDAVIIINNNLEIVQLNHSFQLLFGLHENKSLGENLKTISPILTDFFQKTLDKQKTITDKQYNFKTTLELNIKKREDSPIPIELSLSTWEESSGERFVYGIIRDISERKQNERQIVDLRGIIDSSPSCLKLINIKGELLMMNSVGLDLIESESFENVNKANVYDIVHEKDRQAFKEFNEHICNGGKGSLIFRIIGLKGTERIMETFAQPHQLETGEIGHLAITNEITERIKIEEELNSKDQKLEEAKRLSVIGEFAAGIAHEVNNPLAIIHSKTQLLELEFESIKNIDKKTYTKILSSLKTIKETTTHTSGLIKNLKTFSSKADFENMELVKMKDIVDIVLKISHKRCIHRGIELHLDINPNLKLKCSVSGLSQVILNLISNSIDAIEKLNEKWIKIQTKELEDILQIKITDSGLGIPKEIAKKITQPFFSTKEPGKGTGLGLSISLKSIEKMNGELHYNIDSKNTQFIIEFKRKC